MYIVGSYSLTVHPTTHIFPLTRCIFGFSNRINNTHLALFCASCFCLDLHQLDTIMSTEDIIKVIAYSILTHDNAIHLEEEISDLEGKPAFTDDCKGSKLGQ